MTGYTDFPALKAAGDDSPQRLAIVVNGMLLGKLNCAISVTLAAGVTTTTVDDDRIYETSGLVFCPKTANAAAAPMTYYTSTRGQAVLHHANNANVDRTGVLLVFA